MDDLTLSRRQITALRNLLNGDAVLMDFRYPVGSDDYLSQDEMRDLARRLEACVNPIERAEVKVGVTV